MNTLNRKLLIGALVISFPAIAEENSHKQSIKTGAETVINGAALMGIAGAASAQQDQQPYDSRGTHPKTWKELGDLHKARPSVAEFGN